jgi:hypothetical protein
MFDDSFEVSRSYFTILQLLRIFSDSIHQSVEDLRQMKNKFSYKFPTGELYEVKLLSLPTRQIIAANWEKVLSFQQQTGTELLSRIEKKTEEVKSLRDGVRFNIIAP